MHLSYYTIAEVFGLSEIILLLVKRSKKGGIKNQSDKRSLILLWIVITGSIIIGGIFAENGVWRFPYVITVMNIGVGVAIVGFIIRWIAHFTIRQNVYG
ncbi:MAG: Protein-S-isoprenylcysteine O-methyltransferase Ste14 [Mucilaginibacter sp.]|uniref:hypothetical protein n=1 Tax=Mucilaginibacter sp. TaxID=1882438 RepID=UPI0026173119|nr:hypothetical protein [Mucilaginibacter sp.]MDB5004080.1 Protein-S-isoprenylcysteine O-methyltransferase Ste14 [Mucilaginibacter sp.]